MRKFAIIFFDLQLFAEGGDLVNATTQYVNAYTGQGTPFSGVNDLSAELKTYYDTMLLVNTRARLVFDQMGRRQALPQGHGRTVEWRKFNKVPGLKQLTEAVIPTGEKLGVTAITVALAQYGNYVTVSDLLKRHAIDDVISNAIKELSAAAAESKDVLTRSVLLGGTNILFCDAYDSSGAYQSTPSTESELQTALASYKCNFTPDMILKAVTALKMGRAPTHTGNDYIAIIHPHIAEDLQRNNYWVEAHKYAEPQNIFNGEIGKLHGVRFIETDLAPVIRSQSQSYATYKTFILGADAYAVIDAEGSGLETIIHSEQEAGGPLNQFSTIGCKMETAAKILYPERILSVWGGSSYSANATANVA